MILYFENNWLLMCVKRSLELNGREGDKMRIGLVTMRLDDETDKV